MHSDEADKRRILVSSCERICDEPALGGPIGGGQAAGAPVLIHRGTGNQSKGCLIGQQVAVLLMMWREHHDHEALAAAVAVRAAVKGAAAAHGRQRLQCKSGGALRDVARQVWQPTWSVACPG